MSYSGTDLIMAGGPGSGQKVLTRKTPDSAFGIRSFTGSERLSLIKAQSDVDKRFSTPYFDKEVLSTTRLQDISRLSREDGFYNGTTLIGNLRAKGCWTGREKLSLIKAASDTNADPSFGALNTATMTLRKLLKQHKKDMDALGRVAKAITN